MKTKQRGVSAGLNKDSICNKIAKKYKSNISLIGLFTAFVLCISTSQAYEYGVCLIPFEKISDIRMRNELKTVFYGFNQPEKGALFEWQVPDLTGVDILTTLVNSQSSIFNKEFSDTVNQELISFEGIYRLPGATYSMHYRLYRIDDAATNDQYNWLLNVSPIFDATKVAATPETTFPIPMYCRVDYMFPKLAPGTQKKEMVREKFYSTTNIKSTPDRILPITEKNILDKYLDRIKDKDFAVPLINATTPKDSSSSSSSSSSGSSNLEDATLYYCGFNTDDTQTEKSKKLYASWIAPDNKGINLNRDRRFTLDPFMVVSSGAKTNSEFIILAKRTLKDVLDHPIEVSKSSTVNPLEDSNQATILTFRRDLNQDARQEASNEPMIREMTKQFSVPKNLQSLRGAPKLWQLRGMYKGADLIPRKALCYQLRFNMGDPNLLEQNQVLKTLMASMKDIWSADSKTDEKKD